MSENSAAGVQVSTRLREAIRDAQGVGAFYDKPLSQNGVNIEGIAVKGGRMHLGFRGPSVDGRGFILSADADAVFGKKKLHAKVHALPLGDTTGIRDLAAVRDGVLILTGPVNDQPVTPAVFLWNEKTGALKKLGELAIPEAYRKHKAETLLVLRDEKGKPYRVLVMFDGPENGGPTEYLDPALAHRVIQYPSRFTNSSRLYTVFVSVSVIVTPRLSFPPSATASASAAVSRS